MLDIEDQRLSEEIDLVGTNLCLRYDSTRPRGNVYRPTDRFWYRLSRENGGFAATQFGLAGDIPAPTDFDGDNVTDITVFRPSNGTWFIQQSFNGFRAVQFGANGDVPVAALP